jgi:hypothetical protein
VSSLEFPTEILLVTCANKTLINEWDAQWTKSSEGVHSLGWEGQEKGSWRKFEIVVLEYQWVVGNMRYGWIERDTLFLWIPSPNLGMICC